MTTFIDQGALEDCQNAEQSYGEICVRCNKCGRLKEPTKEQRQKETEAEAEIDRLFDEAFAEIAMEGK